MSTTWAPASKKRKRKVRTRGGPEVYDEGPLYAAAKKVYPQRVQRSLPPAEVGRCCRSASASTTFCLLCGGTGGRTAAPGGADRSRPFAVLLSSSSRSGRRKSTTSPACSSSLRWSLFLSNALFGRVWCGYFCPQTVWTDLFLWVERLVEGDRRDRIKLDAAPWTRRKIGKRVAKHGLWLLIACGTGGACVLYFADAPTLVAGLATLQAPARRLRLDRHPHLHHLFARRPHARAGVPLHVPVAAHPGGADRRRRAQRHLSPRSRRAAHVGQGRRAGARRTASRPAIASTAINASRSARPASTSARVRSSAASNAACASTPATR